MDLPGTLVLAFDVCKHHFIKGGGGGRVGGLTFVLKLAIPNPLHLYQSIVKSKRFNAFIMGYCVQKLQNHNLKRGHNGHNNNALVYLPRRTMKV